MDNLSQPHLVYREYLTLQLLQHIKITSFPSFTVPGYHSTLTLSWPGEGRSALPNLKIRNTARNMINFSKRLGDNSYTCPKTLKMQRRKKWHWFGQVFDKLQWVGQICPSLAICVILEAWPG